MPTPIQQADKLRHVSSLRQLIPFLRNELDWPIDQDASLEEVTYEYDTEELGIDAQYAGAISEIRQLRPLANHQPWGIFWVSFKKKALPVVVLRKILASLVEKKRAASSASERASWKEDDLLFISAYGLEDQRELAIAHFEDTKDGTKPSLKVLQWDASDTTMKLERVLQDMQEKLRWHEEYQSDPERWRQEWASAFRTRIGHVIRTSDKLADALAGLARRIRDRAIEAMKSESARGPLKKMLKAFQESLIHDLDEAGFADTYAQTVTYGLLTAAFSRTEMSEGRHGTSFEAEDITHMVPVTNPFLKEMLGAFLIMGGRKGKIDFDELGIGEVVDLLRGDETDLPAIMADFGNKTRGEDPVIHFYEHFLASYNKELKIKRGVFYTPQPVVSYIVRSVHELLQTEFGLEDGLASTVTWGEMLERLPELKLPTYTDEKGKEVPVSKNEPFVLILDPATGTATFIVETIDVINRHLTEKWKKARMNDAQRAAAWNDYVPKHLLPRLFAYELMMAPYAIAHMKVGLKLAETGYQFASEERVRIYLTNALEPAQQQLRLPDFEPLAHEAEAVNRVKREKRFTVVIGNPPYSDASQNMSQSTAVLIEPFRYYKGDRIKEKGAIRFEHVINNDYVKFIGLSQNVANKAGRCLISLITSNSFLSGKSFRGVRDALVNSFSKITILDLHGEGWAGQFAQKNIFDENVFEITTGVAISTLLYTNKNIAEGNVFYGDIVGGCNNKYELLNNSKIMHTKIDLDANHYCPFGYKGDSSNEEYWNYPQIDSLFVRSVDGIKTSRDGLVIANSPDECISKIRYYYNSSKSPDQLAKEFFFSTKGFDVIESQKYLRKNFDTCLVRKIQYRPLDIRYIYYDKELILSHRMNLMPSMFADGAWSLCFASRLSSKGFDHVVSCNTLCGNKYASHDINSRMFPVTGIFQSLLGSMELDSNFKSIASIPFEEYSNIEKANLFGGYIYAVANSSSYRIRYFDYISQDFPRVPITENLILMKLLGEQGLIIKDLHNLDFEYSGNAFLSEITTGDKLISPKYINGSLMIGSNSVIKNVSKEVWDFKMCGYDVCKSWFTAGRKAGIQRIGSAITDDILKQFINVLWAITETIRIRKNIDQIIERNGGWTGAFAITKPFPETPAQPAPAASRTKAKSKPSGQHADLVLHLEGELPL